MDNAPKVVLAFVTTEEEVDVAAKEELNEESQCEDKS